MSKKVIYISGPISKIADGNYREFALVQEKLEAFGFEVLNPHEICEFIDRTQYADDREYWEACMRECLAKLPYAHKVVTLEGWDSSEGAKIEVATARLTGFISVEHYLTFLPKQYGATA